MENCNISVHIPCPIHSSENIQRVAMNFHAPQELYCFECILSRKDTTFLNNNNNLQTIPDLIEAAAAFYAQHKNIRIKLGKQVPDRYINLLTGQGEKLEQLSKHLEDEKKKMSHLFDTLIQDMTNIISGKKNEYLGKLDQQLFNLRYWFIFFEKQLKKTYPTKEDIPLSFPCKEDLLAMLDRITDSTQLTAFVRNLKEDLNEKKFGIRPELEGSREISLENFCNRLKKMEDVKPHFQQVDDLEVSNLKKEVARNFDIYLRDLLKLEKAIEDVTKGVNLDSRFLESDQITFLQELVPENLKFSDPKPVYRASRDGFEGKDFHEKCDGRKHTISIIKCKFEDSQMPSLIGGYLDEAWQSNGVYIPSSNSFLFSLTTRVKCSISDIAYAGVGTRDYGPCFGGGYDIQVSMNGEQCSMNPHSYEGSSKLVEAPHYSGSGRIGFKFEDIEVYCLEEIF